MSGYLRNKEELIIQEIKNANCLKTKLGKDHTIFSIVDKKLSFVVPNNDSQNIALKEFCYQSNLCSEVEAYDKDEATRKGLELSEKFKWSHSAMQYLHPDKTKQLITVPDIQLLAVEEQAE